MCRVCLSVVVRQLFLSLYLSGRRDLAPLYSPPSPSPGRDENFALFAIELLRSTRPRTCPRHLSLVVNIPPSSAVTPPSIAILWHSGGSWCELLHSLFQRSASDLLGTFGRVRRVACACVFLPCYHSCLASRLASFAALTALSIYACARRLCSDLWRVLRVAVCVFQFTCKPGVHLCKSLISRVC